MVTSLTQLLVFRPNKPYRLGTSSSISPQDDRAAKEVGSAVRETLLRALLVRY